jgi:hypothetical protein
MGLGDSHVQTNPVPRDRSHHLNKEGWEIARLGTVEKGMEGKNHGPKWGLRGRILQVHDLPVWEEIW